MLELSSQSVKNLVESQKAFNASQGQLSSWLLQKEKMVLLFGSVATEPGLVKNQLQQVEVWHYQQGMNNYCAN